VLCDIGREEKCAVFKHWDLKEASEEVERRSGSREFQTDGMLQKRHMVQNRKGSWEENADQY